MQRAFARALRPVKGTGAAEVKDTPGGVIIHVPERKPPSPGIVPRITITAMLTARDATVLHRFAWSQVERDLVGTSTILDEGRTGTTTVEPALMLNKNPMSVTPDPTIGDIVELTREADSEGVVTWSIDHTYYPMFAVFVFNDGGDAGDSTTDCTFTYEIRSIDNVTLATAKTPRQKRYPKTTYIAAPDFSIGYSAWGGPFTPGFALEIVLEEIEKTRDCSGS